MYQSISRRDMLLRFGACVAALAATMPAVALNERRAKLGVPAELAGCHMATMGEYVIEGHVPAEDILTFLAKKPEARGLAVPGMPMGSPGMEMGAEPEAYDVFIFTADGKSQVYARH